MPSRYAIIMAGGRGERFWPLSRPSSPKHLLKLFNGKTLMELTVARLTELIDLDHLRIITSRPQEALMRATLPQLAAHQIIAEPEGRDTTAAVALAARLIQVEDPTATIAMLPADHYMADEPAFRATLKEAFELAEADTRLVTIGIQPTRPATGYGYLQRGERLNTHAFRVAAFKEKPDLATAQEYLSSGNYLWNGGIFVWSLSAIATALTEFAPDIWSPLSTLNPTDTAALNQVYPTLRRISIDFAVMEKAKNVFTVQGSFGWDDVGEWPAVMRHHTPDISGNVIEGTTATVATNGSLIFNNDPNHLVATLGVDKHIIIHTPDATFVAPLDKAQELKKLLTTLNASDALKKFTT